MVSTCITLATNISPLKGLGELVNGWATHIMLATNISPLKGLALMLAIYGATDITLATDITPLKGLGELVTGRANQRVLGNIYLNAPLGAKYR